MSRALRENQDINRQGTSDVAAFMYVDSGSIGSLPLLDILKKIVSLIKMYQILCLSAGLPTPTPQLLNFYSS